MKRRQIIVSVIISLLILIPGALAYQKLSTQDKSTMNAAPKKEMLRSVLTQSFQIQNQAKQIEVDGRVRAVEKINLFAEVTGQIKSGSRNLKKGSTFSEGELLFEIDSEDEKYNLYAQRSALMNSITQIMPDLKFDYPQAFESWKNYLDGFDIQQTLRALPNPSSDSEKYFIAGKNIFNQYYAIKALEDRLRKHQIRAPFNGVFLELNVYPGSLVSPGNPLGSLMNTSKYEIEAPIKMADYEYVKVGQKLSLQSEEMGMSWNGKVNRVSQQLDQSTQSIPVFISVYGRGLKDGLYVKGKLAGANLENVAALPREALVEQTFLYLVIDSTIHKAKVEVLGRDDDSIMVSGIDDSAQVIVSGVNSLYPGQRVSPESINPQNSGQ